VVGVGGCRHVYGTSGGAGVADWDGRGSVLPPVDGTGWAVGKLPTFGEEAEPVPWRLNNNPVGWISLSAVAPLARMTTGRSRVAAGAGLCSDVLGTFAVFAAVGAAGATTDIICTTGATSF
jgi:hypothetical protein